MGVVVLGEQILASMAALDEHEDRLWIAAGAVRRLRHRTAGQVHVRAVRGVQRPKSPYCFRDDCRRPSRGTNAKLMKLAILAKPGIIAPGGAEPLRAIEEACDET